jgi:hypothetical protein
MSLSHISLRKESLMHDCCYTKITPYVSVAEIKDYRFSTKKKLFNAEAGLPHFKKNYQWY